jgi:polyphosphate glucokinase
VARKAVGIDVGGTGIKAAVVDLKKGELISDRIRVETPEGGEPEDIAAACSDLIDQLGVANKSYSVGVCFPAVVKHGHTQSAANVSKRWIGLNADRLFEKGLGRHAHVLNDADAAGVAEIKYGAGRRSHGLTIMTTLGTGIGTALFYNGVLIPNTELGHLSIDGVDDYETKAAYSAMEREELSFEAWAERLQKYYSTLERLLVPDLFIVGGGISKQHEKFLPLLELKTEIVPAKLRNAAGIIGAAALAYASSED